MKSIKICVVGLGYVGLPDFFQLNILLWDLI